MARGKKTGGRNFTKRDPRAGRPKGCKDKVPRGSIKAIIQAFVRRRPQVFVDTYLRGLQAEPQHAFPYFKLGVHYTDGPPPQRIDIRPDLSSLTGEELRLYEQLLMKAHGKQIDPMDADAAPDTR